MTTPEPTTTSPGGGARAESSTPGDASTGELIGRLTTQTSRLVRDELKLAQAELTTKAKQGGKGAGMVGAAGVVALYGLGVLIAAAVVALALVLPLWLSAVIVAVVLFVVAAVVALAGKKKLTQATPALPEQTMDNLKRDVAEVKEHR